jgi:hypothetical protein
MHIHRLSKWFDTNSDVFKSVMKLILKEVLIVQSERRIAIRRLCPKTYKPLFVDIQTLPKASEKEVRAVAARSSKCSETVAYLAKRNSRQSIASIDHLY